MPEESYITTNKQSQEKDSSSEIEEFIAGTG
jgi:hypothetical protein